MVQEKQHAVLMAAHEECAQAEHRVRSLWGCGCIILAALALRMYQLGRDPLWYDETMYGYLASHLNRDVFSGSFLLVEPAFALMVRAWLMLGHGDAWVRCHAVLAGMLALYPAWLLGRRLAGRRGGLYCLLFAATAPMFVYYSRDAKMYGWVILLVLCCMYLGIRCSDTNATARHFGGYVLSAALLCNTHFAAPLYLAVLNLLFLPLFARRYRQTWAWLLSQLAVVACSVPFVLMEIRYLKVMHGKVFHAPIPTLRSLWVTCHHFITAYSPEYRLHVVGVVLAVLLVVASLLFLPGRRKALIFMLGLSVGSVALLFGLSRMMEWSLYVDRYAVGAAGPLVVVMAVGAASLPRRSWRALAVVAWCIVCGFAFRDLYAQRMSTVQNDHLGIVPALDAPSMVRTIDELGRPDDVIWHVYWSSAASLRWYLPQRRHVIVDMGGVLQRSLDMICDRRFQAFYQWHPLEVEAASENTSRIWLVLPNPGVGFGAQARGILEWLVAHGTLLGRFESDARYAPATLYLFDLQDAKAGRGRKTAELAVQAADAGHRDAATVRLNAERSDDNAAIFLDAKNNGNSPNRLPYEAVFADVLCPGPGFQRSLGGASSWSIQRYLANKKMRVGMVFRVHKQANREDALTCQVRLPQGEYAVYLEHTIKGRDYTIPTASFHVDVDTVPFETPCATAEQPGGWVWHHLGNVTFDQEKEHQLTVGVRDPENRAEAYAVMSRIAFVRVPGDGAAAPEMPPQAAGELALPAHGEVRERIAFAVAFPCADILVQGAADVAELVVMR